MPVSAHVTILAQQQARRSCCWSCKMSRHSLSLRLIKLWLVQCLRSLAQPALQW